MTTVGPPAPVPLQSLAPESSAALARLAATTNQATARAFSAELAAAVSGQSKSDSSSIQQNTAASTGVRAGIFAPASAGTAAPAANTTSTGSGKSVKAAKRSRKKTASLSSNR